MAALGRYLRTVQGGGLMFWCPGCEGAHAVVVEGKAPWEFNGNPDKPSFTPSVSIRSGHFASHFKAGDNCWCTYDAEQRAKGEKESGFKCVVCHSYVTDGRIQFLGDSTHALSGQTVDLPPFPGNEEELEA